MEPSLNWNKEPSINLNKVAKFFQVSAHVHLCHPQHLKTIAYSILFFCNSMGPLHEAVRSALLDGKRHSGGRKTKEILHHSKS